jgi:hypothetical protein
VRCRQWEKLTRRRKMKNDRYIKFVLTVIALCLVWICVRDIRIGGNFLFAQNPTNRQQEVYVTGGELDVNVVRVSGTALTLAEPIQVEVVN